MFRTSRSTVSGLSRELHGLPPQHLTYLLDDAWLVVGPTGLFVLLEDEGDIAAAAAAVVRYAGELRSRLCDTLAWVPFVDAVVITNDPRSCSVPECLVVPIDMLRDMICNGPRTIDPQPLMQLALIGLQRQV